MRKLFLLFLAAACGAVFAHAQSGGGENVKIKMSFEGKEVIVSMQDNAAARQLLDMLPAEFAFSDYAGEEKITSFSRPLDLSQAPRGMVAKAGRMFIYAPWGNMGFFYKDHGTKNDTNLIWLGDVQSGLAHLAAQKGPFTARLEILKGSNK